MPARFCIEPGCGTVYTISEQAPGQRCPEHHAQAQARRKAKRDSRPRGTREQRGYDHAHRVEREHRLAVYQPGDICAHGGEVLTYWPIEVARRNLDLPHTPDRTGYLPGLSCAKHNQAAGNRRDLGR